MSRRVLNSEIAVRITSGQSKSSQMSPKGSLLWRLGSGNPGSNKPLKYDNHYALCPLKAIYYKIKLINEQMKKIFENFVSLLFGIVLHESHFWHVKQIHAHYSLHLHVLFMFEYVPVFIFDVYFLLL